MDSNSQPKQLNIRLITKQKEYSVPDTPFAVSSAISISELNSLVKQLINESEIPDNIEKKLASIEFDFIAAGEFIRSSLIDHLTSRSHTTEAVVDIEYLEKLPTPEPQDCLLHNDWVSAVQTNDKWILTGSYDNSLHLWNFSGKHLLSIPGHTAAIKAVGWISTSGNILSFASGSQDQTAAIYQWDTDKNEVECVAFCKGHAKSIECLAVSPDGAKFVTGSWDQMLKIWSTSLDDDTGISERKKSKKTSKSCTKTPLVTLKGHKGAVSSLVWRNEVELASCSWDHTIRIWDMEMNSSIQEIIGNKAFYCIDSNNFTKVIIAASSDRHIRLYDPRSQDSQICKTTFSSHTQWVTCVKWSPSNEHLFVSGSNDFSVKLWDDRSPAVPLFELKGHEDKVMCCDWTNSFIATGGADNSLRLFKVNDNCNILT